MLGGDVVSSWQAAVEENPLLSNPFFRPEFVLAVASVREDVFVTLVEQSGRLLGFFPFQRREDGVGIPVGGSLSDYQGLAGSRFSEWATVNLLRASGLKAWQFDHLLAAQQVFPDYHETETESHVIDLTAGYESYWNQHLKGIAELRKRRNLERDVGPVRFEQHSGDQAALEILMQWKARQYGSSGKGNIFAEPWVVQLLERLQQTQRPEFTGCLSVLYAGDIPLAAHMGLRSATVWHYWLPTYDPAFGKYSPGMILLMEMIRAASEEGIQTIDLGKGRMLYKQRLQNRTFPLVEGIVPASPVSSLWSAICGRGRAWYRQSTVFAPVRDRRRRSKGTGSQS